MFLTHHCENVVRTVQDGDARGPLRLRSDISYVAVLGQVVQDEISAN